MRYSVRDYATALAEVAERSSKNEVEGVVDRFVALLERTGDVSALPKIVRAAGKILRLRTGGKEILIESARPLTGRARAAFKKLAGPKDGFEEKLNPALVAGIRVTVNGERQLDASLKRKLGKLFQ